MLIGYFIGPFGAMLSSGIFTSFLQAYLGDVLGLDAGFLSVLQLVSTALIVAANLIVGQLIERMHCLEGNAPRNRQNHTVQHEQVFCKIK